uniref:Polyprenal reductase n=1 Tax=Nyssomyia neivai TaxID=330878 RepID=A0A1L8DY83_9DIPT
MTPTNSQINIIEVIFWCLALGYVAMGLVISVLEKFMPPTIRRILFYGKVAGGDFRSLMFVPKSWFRHFYIFATIWGSLVVILTIGGLSMGTIPSCFIDFLNFICGTQRTVQCTFEETLLALILLFIHILVRCYETNFTQVFSKTATMNLIQYLISFVYYFGVIVLLVCKGDGFVTGYIVTSSRDFSWRLGICCATFAFASYHQFNSHRILANLRRDRRGKVTTEGHFVPTGGYFEVVSSPHMLFECLIYFSIFGVVHWNSSWLAVMALVLANQVTMARETHLWYKKNFPNYPINRKALIPYIF